MNFKSDQISSLFLIGANLVPLLGAIFLDWSVFEILMIFWLENVVLGFINILKMGTLLVKKNAFETVLLIPFFTIHYGLFCLVHGIFVFAFFGKEIAEGTLLSNHISNMLWFFWDQGLIWAVLALFVSHLASFVINFIKQKEYENVTSNKLMGSPYARIVILHVTILFGGFLVMQTGQTKIALALLVILKIIIDLTAHHREHRVRMVSGRI